MYPTCYNTRELWKHGDTGYWINYGRAWRRYVPCMLQHAWTVTTRDTGYWINYGRAWRRYVPPHVTTRVNCDNTGTPDTGLTTEGHGGGMYPHMLQHAWTVTTRGHRILDKLWKGMEEVCTLHVTTRVNCDNPGHRILDKLRTGMEESVPPHVTTRVNCENTGHRILDKRRKGMEEVCIPTCYNTRELWQHGDTGYWINYGRAWRR